MEMMVLGKGAQLHTEIFIEKDIHVNQYEVQCVYCTSLYAQLFKGSQVYMPIANRTHDMIS